MSNRMFQDFEDGQFSAQAEIDRLKAKLVKWKELHDSEITRSENLKRQLAEARAELASYKAGVEVEGEIDHNGHNGLFVSSIMVQQSYCGIDEFKQGQRVKVLVRAID